MSSYTPGDQLPTPQRRIRHITSLQIRNLTPFPARDALAQSLTQPGPSSSSFPQQPADDIDLTVTARRRRRISAGSIATILNLEAEDEGGSGIKRQTRSGSKGSFQGSRNAIFGTGTSTSRPRARTSSKTSSVHLPPAPTVTENVDPDSPNDQGSMLFGGHFVTHSQRALEKIVSTRLVETFVTLTLQSAPASRSPSQPNSPPASPSMIAIGSPRKGKDVSVKRAVSASVANHRRGGSTSSSTSTLSAASSSHPKRPQSLALASSSASSRNRTNGSIRATTSASRAVNFPSPPPTPPPQSSPRRTPTPTGLVTRPAPLPGRRPDNGLTESPSSPILTPFYISPLHLPSTNPSFAYLDPEREFAPWADLSGSCVKIAIWGGRERLRSTTESGKDAKGKGKEKVAAHAESGGAAEDSTLWEVLEEWMVDLDDVETLSPDVAAHHLPSNTLLLTLSSGETYRIPPISSLTLTSSSSRPSSPLGPEYNSDGEVDELRRRRSDREASDGRRRERETLEKSLRETRMKRSAAWQDLVKIVNLQTCIVDTQESLEEVVRKCDLLLEGDGHNASLRDFSEREEWVRMLRAEREQVLQRSAQVEDAIEARRKTLEVRRNTLAAVRAMYEKDLHELAAQAQEVDSERQRHTILVSSLPPLRATLIQTVSFIFPIEPLSAADLLFTIVGAPLPIPLSSSDPAPPLSLPSRPEVTDDTTATALGNVAQVVQHLSAYLGKGLVYPVTCCGSRSAIKDPISAMMGPRMFPLYSKGVETYRFEYGVFLLNKNIEMLMMDRNLRAMDMRHTLPNLKNLLLTLTTGEGAKQTRPMSPIIAAITSGMRSPTRAISPLALGASQPESPFQPSAASPGSTGSRKSTPFLSPLAAILRARYPSSAGRPTVKIVDETPEPTVEGDGSIEPSPEQPIDIAMDTPPTTGGTEVKLTVKANGTVHTLCSVNENESPFEKLANTHEPPTPPPPLPGVS